VRVAISSRGTGPQDVDYVVEAERLGVDSVWTAEMWGHDALTPLAYLAAKTERIRLGTGILQLGARTPALLAMSAMSMQAISGGRFLLGLGTSGPQVVEGWHGVRFDAPIARTRETVEIIRKVTAGERLAYDGAHYRLPLPDGPGRAIRPMAPPVHVPIYIASLGPRNLELTGEVADGWLGTCFMPETASAFLEPIAAGLERAGRTMADLDIAVAATVELTDDEEEAARRHARGYAFTIGAMGSPEQNFYNDAFGRQGFGEDVAAVQRLWLEGKREEAAERVPIELGRRTNLLGPRDTVRERLIAYRDAGVTTLRVGTSGSTDERLATLETLVELCRELG
jgi:F420-dependent oxidoreductase-like protein